MASSPRLTAYCKSRCNVRRSRNRWSISASKKRTVPGPSALVLLKRDIGIAPQCGSIGAVGWEECDADAQSNPCLVTSDFDGVGNSRLQTSRDRKSTRL